MLTATDVLRLAINGGDVPVMTVIRATAMHYNQGRPSTSRVFTDADHAEMRVPSWLFAADVGAHRCVVASDAHERR
jgi:hypothetical protein